MVLGDRTGKRYSRSCPRRGAFLTLRLCPRLSLRTLRVPLVVGNVALWVLCLAIIGIVEQSWVSNVLREQHGTIILEFRDETMVSNRNEEGQVGLKIFIPSSRTAQH